MVVDGKTTRLRASCNACNESKVRCSQRKPTCARCERNGVECIYGLSRRTHKDAPPISMPPSQRSHNHPRGASRSSSSGGDTKANSNSSSNWHMSPNVPFMIPPQQQQQQQKEEAAAAAAATPRFQCMYTPQDATADTVNRAGLLLDMDFSSLVTGSSSPLTSVDPLSAAVTRFPTPGAEHTNPWALGPFFGGNTNNNSINNPDWTRQPTTMGPMITVPTTAPPSPSPSCTECSCHAGVTELLSSMRGGGDDRRLSLDAQLAKLKRCIVSSETSMGCAHGRDDAEPIHILAVSTLIGYVIDEFEMLASESPLRLSSSLADMSGSRNAERVAESILSSGSDESMSMSSMAATTGVNNMSMSMSMGNLLEPRLSWGVLELEDDDEVDLRQRLYLLSFRKLERLLSQLTIYLRNLHDARAGLPEPSRHMAFVMACDYTRLWLEKKAEDVKRMFLVARPAGDETMDPALMFTAH
uniref:Transcription factor phomD n=1 Tax=Diaporthe leptostromiformis TaxID=291059 RepID=PHOD1_DIALO|nr:RecName: Full=Transcription factor phomD; AltName: Full=Phomopsin biosynthesis cluster protein D [Diaporthe leptostromiformis]BDA39135.1 transcriptional regulator [Diaporthe leptostromiformis]